MELTFPFLLPFQERLSYIGPEEFIQAFIQKDPLDNKVMSTNPQIKECTVVVQTIWLICADGICVVGVG